MREDPQDRERQVRAAVSFRDVVAALVMLTVVTALALVVIGMIHLFAPPVEHRPPPIRTSSTTPYCAVPASSALSMPRSVCSASPLRS